MITKRKNNGICYHCERKGHRRRDCKDQQNGCEKKNKKGKKAIDGDDDELVLCSFMEDVMMPTQAALLCTIDGDTFHSFAKNTWIGDSCHNMNDNSDLF